MKNSLAGFYSFWLLIVLIVGSMYPPSGFRKTKEGKPVNDTMISRKVKYGAVFTKISANGQSDSPVPYPAKKQLFVIDSARRLNTTSDTNNTNMLPVKQKLHNNTKHKKHSSLIILTSGQTAYQPDNPENN